MNGEVVNRQLSNQLEYYSADKGYYDTGCKSSSVKARPLDNRPPGYDRPFFTSRYENELKRQGHRIKRCKDKSPSHHNARKGELSIISSHSEEELHRRDEPSNQTSIKATSSCNAVCESRLTRTDIPDSKQKPRPRPRQSRDRHSDKNKEHRENADGQDKSRERDPQYMFDQNGFIDGYNGLSDRKQSSKSDKGRENSKTRSSGSKHGSRNSRNNSKRQGSDRQGSSTSFDKRERRVSDVNGIYCELVPLEKKISVDSYRGGSSVRDNSDCHSIASEPSNARHTAARGKRTGSRTSKKHLPNRTPKQSKTCCGPRSKQKRRCLVCLSILMVFVTLCIVTAGVLVYVRMRDADKGTSLYDMVKAHVRLRIVNKEYSPALGDPESGDYSSFAATFCKEVNTVYLMSALATDYFGCSLRTTRAGSVHVYFVSPFLDSPHSSNVSVHEEILTNGQPRTSGTRKDVPSSGVNKENVTYGDFIVEVNSIDIFLEKYTTDRLPPRPELHSLPTSDIGIEKVPSSTTTEQPPTKSPVPSRNPTVTTTSTTMTTTQGGNEEAAMKTKVKVIVDATALPTNDAVTSIHVTSSSNLDNFDLFGIDDITTDSYMNYSYTATTVPVTNHSIRNKTFQTTVPVKIKRTTVRVIGDEVSLGQSATISCQVFTDDEIETLTFKRTNQNGKASLMASFTGDQLKSLVTGKPHSEDGGNVILFKMEGTVVVRLSFSSVGCKDTGDFKCSVQLADGTNSTGQGRLIGRGPPGQPVLSVPQPLVENRELITPITCTGNVGFPPGRLSWLIKPRGSTEFFSFDGNIVSTSGTCDNYVTNSLIYTPTRDGNGTLLKCVVVNENVPMTTELSAVTEMQILSEHLCEGVSKSRKIRHPFTCTKYIRCRGNKDFVVHDCENQMCFDEKSGKCGQISLIMPTVNAILNDGVALLKCRLIHNGAWNTLTISKLSSSGLTLPTSGDKITSSGDKLSVSGSKPSTSGDEITTSGEKTRILTVTSGVRSATVHESAMSGRVHTFVDESKLYQVEVSLWVELTCEDEGVYVCEVDAPFYVPGAVGNITVEAQPGAPELTIPNEIVENLPMRQNISCEADVGYPHGTLVLKIKRPSDHDFITVPNQTTTEETQNCSQIVTTSFSYVPRLEHNGMLIRCELENNVTLPFDHKYVAEEKIHVLPGNFCQLAGERSIQEHPYDCHQYVSCLDGYIYVQRCGSSHCFDPMTSRCDRAVKSETEFDPRHPCLPDKTGVFFRHPVLCNKFYWCVQGRAVVRHCPLGTLYLDGGQCTFEPNRSLCYKDMTQQ